MKFIKIILFIILSLILINSLSDIILLKFNSFKLKPVYDEKQVDILFLGPSTTYHAISPMYIWDKYNIKTYNVASSSQHELITFSYLKALKKLKPKIIIFDIGILVMEQKYTIGDIAYLNNIDNLFLRFNTSKQLDPTKKFENINTFLLYHNRWKNLTKTDFINTNYLKGYSVLDDNIYRVRPQKPILMNDIVDEDMSHYIYKYIKILQQYAIDNNIKLIIISTPLADNDYRKRKDKYYNFEKVAKKYNIDYLNFTKLSNTINIDYDKDFFDNTHVNMYGGKKITDYLMTYIIDKYGITLYQKDEKWDKDLKKYNLVINAKELKFQTTLTEWSKKAKYDGYIIIVASNGKNLYKNIPQNVKKQLQLFGLSKLETDNYKQNYVAIINDNKVFFEEFSDNRVEYKGRMKDIVNLNIFSEPNKSIINISGKQRSKNKKGINIVVYDKVNREVVDSIWIDPNEPDKVRR